MNQSLYTTNDPYLASFVISEGGVLAGCQRLGPKKVEFRFVPDRQLHEILRVYWSRLPIHVTPYCLYAALRFLKRRTMVLQGIHSTQTTISVSKTITEPNSVQRSDGRSSVFAR